MPLRGARAFLLFLLSLTATAEINFQQQSYPAMPWPLMRADVNNDGFPDLLSVGSNGTNVVLYMLLNKGDGTFQPPRKFAVPAQTAGLLTASDWNRDRNVDLIGCTSQPGGDMVPTILYGDGAASFPRSSTLAVAGDCRRVAVGDFNKDGKLDLAVAWVSPNADNTPNNAVTVFFGDGAGNVSNTVTTTDISVYSSFGPCWFEDAFVGDFDVDTHNDLLLVAGCPNDSINENIVVLARGDDTGHFTFLNTLDVNRSLDLRIDDIDQNGPMDLVALNSYSRAHASGGSALDLVLNSPARGSLTWGIVFDHSYDYYGGPTYVSSVSGGTAADVDGDGIKDAIVLDNFAVDEWNGPIISSLIVQPGLPDGTYGSAIKFPLSGEARGVVAGDFDRDGRTDLAFVTFTRDTPGATQVFLNRTSGAPGCSADPVVRSVRICAPARTSSTSLHLLSNTTDNEAITGMWVYLDDKKGIFHTPNELVNRVLTLPTGGHRLTVKAWDALGSFSSSRYITVGTGFGCAAPGTNRTINLCFPTNNMTVGTPMQVVAAVNDSNTYTGAKIYVDGVLKFSTASRQVSASLPLKLGSHRVTVKASDNLGSFSKTVSVTVR